MGTALSANEGQNLLVTGDTDKLAPGGTGPSQGTLAGGENPAPKFMQTRKNFHADPAQRASM